MDKEAERGGLSRKQVWQQRVLLGILCLRVLASCSEGPPAAKALPQQRSSWSEGSPLEKALAHGMVENKFVID